MNLVRKESNSRKSHENSRNLLEAFLRSRKEENLYGHCDMNKFRIMPEEFFQKALHS